MVHGYGNDISCFAQSSSPNQASPASPSISRATANPTASKHSSPACVDLAAQDWLSFFNSVQQDPQFHGLPCFLYGESMGGAICFMNHFAAAPFWSPPCAKSPTRLDPNGPFPKSSLSSRAAYPGTGGSPLYT